MSTLRLTDLARADLADIRAYIAGDKPSAADRQIVRFFETFHILAANPELGERCDQFAEGLRCFSKGAYVIFYRPIVDGVEIARVVSGYRDLPALF
jgi:toxin ParE1/3/4